ncbi:MAG TPA: cytochrome P450 [Acidimicrobiales bacterium]|nr:cytochrome P450 [Acidimicrobiales bacterium]
MKTLGEAPFLNIFDPAVQSDVEAVVRRLGAQSAVLRTPIGAAVVGRAEVQALLRNRAMHSSLLNLVRLQGVTDGPVYEIAAASLLAKEGDDHTRIRRLVSRSFTPRAADAHRPFMRRLVGELVGGFREKGECEFMSEFADHYPVQVIAHLMGVPAEDHPMFARWGDALTHVLSLELALHRDLVQAALEEMAGYLGELIAERRRAPREDLVSELISARDGQDRLDDRELLALLGGLLFAGYDTTRNQLAVAMTIFAERPVEWTALAADPGAAAAVVEEVMRYQGVVSVVPRVATEDVEVGGYTIPAGTLVSLSLAAANRDPSAYPDPGRFDVSRADPEPHVGFGGGHHHCLGANLARAEMQEALPILSASMPDMRIAEEPEWRSPLGGISGPLRLRLRFRPAPNPSG